MPLPAVDFVLMLPDPESPSEFVSVANCSNVQHERTNSDEDVSTKGDNGDRKLYPAGAQRSQSISCDFVAEASAPFTTLKTAAFSSTPSVLARLDDGTDTFTGVFQISNFSQQAGAFGAVTGSFTLNSSGAIEEA